MTKGLSCPSDVLSRLQHHLYMRLTRIAQEDEDDEDEKPAAAAVPKDARERKPSRSLMFERASFPLLYPVRSVAELGFRAPERDCRHDAVESGDGQEDVPLAGYRGMYLSRISSPPINL